MATKRDFVCPTCGARQPAGGLYEALSTVAVSEAPNCLNCGSRTRLQLDFALALGAQGNIGEVMLAVRGQQGWKDGQSDVDYFPFLVVIRPTGAKEEAVWLPYWHRVSQGGQVKLKYGQWAPYMDVSMFHELLQGARAKGWEPKKGGATV